uniref:Non-haem dioxygenase N-terminal domain-containing protein n=1 Tax=Cucumis melo TaxID=3656 RepID=A0A9I9D493_CUCME
MVMMSPERAAATPFEFRAPPPSPIGTSRRSSVTNDEILDSMRSFGFFQLVNHGIPVELIGAVAAAADAGVFGISPEKKVAVGRSPEKAYGFEELWHGEDESEVSEEFVWNRDEDLKMEMEAISPIGYSNFSKKMEWLTQLTEKLGEKILEIFLENSGKIARNEVFSGHGSVWCVYKQKIKQRLSVWNDELENCFKHDVIRMLIRGTDFSHAFCFHFCHGSSPLFHAYSKRGWVSFVADESAVVVTVGDHIQGWSGGQYKHVIGRPIYKDHNKEEQSGSNNNNNGISMAFLFSPTSSSSSSSSNALKSPNEIRTLSLAHQALFALFLTLLYNFFFYILK